MSEHPVSWTQPGLSPKVPSALQASEVVGEWYWDEADRVVASRGVAELLGLDPDRAAQGLSGAAFLAAVHPGDRDWLVARNRVHARKGGICVAEYRVVAADGTTRWVMSRGRYYLDEAGVPLGGSGVLIDVTEARLEGEEVEATAPGAQIEHPVLRLGKHALALRRTIDELGQVGGERLELRMKADELLTAIGFAIARLIAPSGRSLN